MDKILLTAFLSALAGFITAVLSIVKLVNEKESKTSDHRQAWTDSVRSSFAQLIGLINTQASQKYHGSKTREELNKLLKKVTTDEEETQKKKRLLDYYENSLQENRERIRETRKSIYEAYALVQLHFKPNDLSFNRIEQKFDIIMSHLSDMSKSNDDERTALKEKIHGLANEITSYSRDILKIEWENVKKGEPAYKLTKKWSIAGSIVMMFLLISIGLHAAISIWKDSITKNTEIETQQDQKTKNN